MATTGREWWETFTGLLIAFVIAAAVVCATGIITWGIVRNAQGKRDLFRECINAQPPHALSDCRNNVYGYGH